MGLEVGLTSVRKICHTGRHLIFLLSHCNYWWGRQDSNLRSHEAADLQSAPFATRDTPPLDSIVVR
jgi:hypothetical protein